MKNIFFWLKRFSLKTSVANDSPVVPTAIYSEAMKRFQNKTAFCRYNIQIERLLSRSPFNISKLRCFKTNYLLKYRQSIVWSMISGINASGVFILIIVDIQVSCQTFSNDTILHYCKIGPIDCVNVYAEIIKLIINYVPTETNSFH